MVTEKLLEDCRRSRNLTAIPVWGTIGLILMLLGLSTYFLADITAFSDIFDLFVIDIHLNEKLGFTMTLTEVIKHQGWALFGLPGGLILLILGGIMKSRKSGYTPLFVLTVLDFVAAILMALFLGFLLPLMSNIIPESYNWIFVLVYTILLWAFFGLLALFGILSWFDHGFHGKSAPIYERLKQKLKELKGDARTRYKKTFKKLWTRKRYSEMVLMLYEDNVASGINSPMDQATFDFMKKDIVNSYGKVKAEELTYLYNTGQYDALRDDKKAIDEALASGKRVYDPKPIAPQKVKVKDKSGNVREVEIETAEADNNKIDDKTMRLIRKGELQAKKERRR